MGSRRSFKGRVLAIVPTSRGGFGFVVLEGPERLVDWGTVAKNSLSRLQSRLERLMHRYTPQRVIVPASARRGRRSQEVLKMGQAASAKKRIRCCVVALARGHFGKKKTKHQRATEITERFSELKPWLPKARRPWTSEAEVMAIFDALSLAFAISDPELERRRVESELR